jgi:L-alanine-DL-glutamate epimerase-like enolase superfamily enzyme
MAALELTIETRTLALAEPFKIAGYVFDTTPIVVVTLDDGAHTGRGEAAGVFFLKEDVPAMVAAIEAERPRIEAGPTRDVLRTILPPGGARNAVDSALWELGAVRTGRPVWQLAGLGNPPRALRTTFTLGADTPERMAQKARDHAQARSIKIKLTGDLELDIARVAAIRAARPGTWLGVDGNQGFRKAQLEPLVGALVDAEVSLLEQPLPRDRDADLEGFASPIPLAGDESVLSLPDVARAKGRFDVINIKLDKCGGLTEGLLMVAEARRLDLGVMVGTMVGSSLATAPGFVLGQFCDLVDLDGPTFLACDHVPSVVYDDGMLWAGAEVWGSPESVR